MTTIPELLARAAALREETALNSISPERAGGIMYDTLIALNELWLQQGSALVISKIYSSVSAMEADDEPVSDISGQPLRAGQIVVIASNGSVYRFGGISEGASVWTLVGLIGNITPVDALDSDSVQLPLAAHQGKVLDGKISQLGKEKETNFTVDGTTISEVVTSRYVRYDDGSIAKSGNFNSYKIDLSSYNIKKIHAKVGANDTIPAAIAYYSDTPSSITYLKSASVQMNSTRDFVSLVPENAKYVIISTNINVISVPEITLYESNDITGSMLRSFYAGKQYRQIYTRDASATTTEISGNSISLGDISVGEQIELNVTELSGNSDAYFSLNGQKFKIVSTGRYFFDYMDGMATTFDFRKEAAENNVFNFTVAISKNYTIQQRLTPNYVLTDKANISLGTPYRGYYNASKVYVNDWAWVSYPVQWSNGYVIHINTDFTTYYVQLRTYGSGFMYNEIRIQQEQDFAIPYEHGWNLMFRRIDRQTLVPSEVDGDVVVTFAGGNIWEKPLVESEVKKIANDTVSPYIPQIQEAVNTSNAASSVAKEGYAINVFANEPCYYHFASAGFIKDADGNNTIPSESLDDVAFAARLGFKFIEANIQITADNKFVCIHGDSGKFGTECKSSDENVITTSELQNTAISSKTLDWIKTYVKYNSDFEKYQTSLPTLEEFCQACKIHGIGIFAGVNGRKAAVEICVKYIGNNVIIYAPPQDIRNYFNGYVFTWHSGDNHTPTSLLTEARAFGAPYMCGLYSSVINSFIENDLLDGFLEDMHKEGFLVGFAGTYESEANGRLFTKLGFDFNGSGHEVNPFESNYEMFDLDSESLPATTGFILNGVATLAEQETITCGSSTKITGKGWLSLRFNGNLAINFGHLGQRVAFTSDGKEDIVISDYFFNTGTSLIIKAYASTTITNFVYKTSKC